jgi:hypothetical protein
VAQTYNTENMVPQEDETVSPIPDGKFWRPGHVSISKYLGLPTVHEEVPPP